MVTILQIIARHSAQSVEHKIFPVEKLGRVYTWHEEVKSDKEQQKLRISGVI